MGAIVQSRTQLNQHHPTNGRIKADQASFFSYELRNEKRRFSDQWSEDD